MHRRECLFCQQAFRNSAFFSESFSVVIRLTSASILSTDAEECVKIVSLVTKSERIPKFRVFEAVFDIMRRIPEINNRFSGQG